MDNGTWRCHHCDDVIGVYEPMIVLADGRARRTSRAGEQNPGAHLGECYHHACYARTHGEGPVPE
jgi:hypothetical protein